MSTKKNTVKMPAIPKTTPKTLEDFATYLLGLNKVGDMSCKTWDKIPGCYSIKCRGKIIGEFYLSKKSGTYRISTRSTYFKSLPSNGRVIKNGLDLNVAQCNNIAAGVSFLRNVAKQIVDKANAATITLYDADDFVTKEEVKVEEKA